VTGPSTKWENIPIHFGRCILPDCGASFAPADADIAHEGNLFCPRHRIGGQQYIMRGWSVATLVHWPKCRWCDATISAARYEQYLEDGFEPGNYVYCDAHAAIEGRDPELIARRGLEEGLALSEISDDRLVRWPLKTLHRMTGPLVPGRVHYVAGFSGGGKTTFLRNCIWQWIQERGLRIRYLPLESSVKEVMAGFAAFRANIDPDEVLSYRLRDRARAGDPEAKVQREELHIAYQVLMRDTEFMQRLRIEPIDTLSPQRFEKAIASTKAMGADLIIVDHVDHTEADADSFAPDIVVSNRIQHLALRAAKDLDIPVLLASQFNSKLAGTDPLARMRPPRADYLWNRGAKEMIAAMIIGLHRVVDPYADGRLLKKVRDGHTPAWKVAIPNIMGVSEVKLRYGRGTNQSTVMLDLIGGRLGDRKQDIFDRIDQAPVPQTAPSRPDSTSWMDN
jgi:KaiC/GvpD/RAD55 family RecA-like ATPase